jgi:hypothetical protein
MRIKLSFSGGNSHTLYSQIRYLGFDAVLGQIADNDSIRHNMNW